MENLFALVVDDEKEWRELVRKALESLGFVVEEAESLMDASGALQDRDFDLHVFDNTLGPLTSMGAELIRTAQLFRDKQIRAIVYSGDLPLHSQKEVEELGGVYVRKSPDKDPTPLTEAVKKLMT